MDPFIVVPGPIAQQPSEDIAQQVVPLSHDGSMAAYSQNLNEHGGGCPTGQGLAVQQPVLRPPSADQDAHDKLAVAVATGAVQAPTGEHQSQDGNLETITNQKAAATAVVAACRQETTWPAQKGEDGATTLLDPQHAGRESHGDANKLRRRVSTSRQYTEDFQPGSHDQLYASIPQDLLRGTVMLKVSAKKTQRRMVKLRPEAGQLVWESKHAGILSIDSIRELRFGADARGFREHFRIAPDSESRWITIIYVNAGKYRILHLVALTSASFEMWRDTLVKLYEERKELLQVGNGGFYLLDQFTKRQNLWLKQNYSQADRDNDQKLHFRDVLVLVKNLNISASDRDLRANFEAADSAKRGYLDFTDFQHFVKLLRRRPEVGQIVHSITGGKSSMSLSQFASWLRETQKSVLTEAAIKSLFEKFAETATSRNASSTGGTERTMSEEGFTAFLMSSENMAMDEKQLQVCDDMSKPLCEYFISTSHNTYLVGGQLKGDSTAEGYIRALQQGCRSVELDIWDGPEEPVVYHGRTLTSRLPVREALLAIGKYAFIASPYPVILSMEIHCDHAQQDKLAEILKATLGQSLLDSPLFGEDQHPEHPGATLVERLPSPEELKYRILVKAKNLYVVKAASGSKGSLDRDSEDSSSTSSDSDFKKVFNSAMRIIRREPAAPSVVQVGSPSAPQRQQVSQVGMPPASPPAKQSVFSVANPPISPKHGSPGYFASTTIAPNPAAPAERQQLDRIVSRDGASSSSSAHGSGGNGNSTSSNVLAVAGSNIARRLSLSRLRSRSDNSVTWADENASVGAPSASTKASISGTSPGRSASTATIAAAAGRRKEKPLMSFALAGLIVYTVGVKWRGLNKKEAYGPSHVFSLGERRMNKLVRDPVSRNDLVAHNRSHLVRTYPAGTRFTSSNYLPIYFWAVGVSLVALNWQTFDLGLEINNAFFSHRNGRSGYILKPDILRSKRADEKDKDVLGKVEKYVLVLDILSAQQLPRPQKEEDQQTQQYFDIPTSTVTTTAGDASASSAGSTGNSLANAAGKSGSSPPTSSSDARAAPPSSSPSLSSLISPGPSPMNPFVEVSLYTPTLLPGDVNKMRTPVVFGNGFNPVWSSKFHVAFSVPVDMLELAFLRLEVKSHATNAPMNTDDSAVSLGKYTVSVAGLMPGYRHVPLYDHLGQQYLFSSLFLCSRLVKSD